ncbi:hypothetical protein SKAU_G00365090 [Synaphobranchus kaupii]|uniref:Uncharacterized protein n=1 Tax=Synaphobranchus kaupii TaxID=118154 RepID=A0A9Q1ID96_SYNKA|nr:hypothetical protein SKAU_G00365090 [Synaphobranchus kaupii]
MDARGLLPPVVDECQDGQRPPECRECRMEANKAVKGQSAPVRILSNPWTPCETLAGCGWDGTRQLNAVRSDRGALWVGAGEGLQGGGHLEPSDVNAIPKWTGVRKSRPAQD